MSDDARSAALRICFTSSARGSVESNPSMMISVLSLITVRRLLKSCAIPPASRPTASIFCDCLNCSSRFLRSVRSIDTRTNPSTVPCSSRTGDVVSRAGKALPDLPCTRNSPVQLSPTTPRSKISLACSRRNGEGVSSSILPPTASSAVHPYNFSAKVFQKMTSPSASVATTACWTAFSSWAWNRIAASERWRSVMSVIAPIMRTAAPVLSRAM